MTDHSERRCRRCDWRGISTIEHAACEPHRSRPKPPVPDPHMAEAHLRRTRGSMYTPARTVFDNVVEAKGQRVSAAKRAHIRGDTDTSYEAQQ
jgi:hypothetical protein